MTSGEITASRGGCHAPQGHTAEDELVHVHDCLRPRLDTRRGQFALRSAVEQGAYRPLIIVSPLQSTISDGMLTAKCHRRETPCRLTVICLICAIPALAAAQADFSRSTMTHEPSTVVEGDVVTYTVTLRNTGSEDAPYTDVVVDLPLEGLFIDLDGLDATAIDRSDKRITATLNLPANAEHLFRVRIVVPRDAGGNRLLPKLEARYLHRSVSASVSDPTDIGTPPRPGGVRIGGVRIGLIEGCLLALIALYPTLWVLLPRRRRTHGTVTLLVLGTSFLVLFGGLAWRDAQTLTSWPQAQCTILDTRIRLETVSSGTRSGQPRRAELQNYKPLLAVRYVAHGRDVISTGYETGTRVAIGRGESLLREYQQWQVGSQVECWFNPDDVKDVIVIRGFGGAYFFAIFPLALLGLGILSLRH